MLTRTRAQPTEIAAAVAHLAWTSVLVVGAPITLWRLFGWPLPTAMPDWGEVVSTQLQLVDPLVILNTFVSLAWICWAVIVGYVVADVVDTMRGVGQRLHRIGPFGAVAGKLVGSAALLVSLARPTVAVAAPTAPPPIIQLADVDDSPLTEPVPIPAPADWNAANVEAPAPAAPNPVHVVQRGDNLWAIAETHLGDGFRWTEIHDLNRDLITDPNLICVGWHLTLPADAAPLSVGAVPHPLPAPPTAEPAPTPVPEPPVDAEGEPAVPADAAADAVDDLQPVDDSGSEGPAPRTPPEPPVTGPLADDHLMPALVDDVPGITGATVLATGLLLALRHRRRRQAHGPLPRHRVTPLERSLVAAADLPLVRWVGQELAILGELIAGRRHPAIPVAVEFSEATGIEILWDQPFPDAPPPWEAMPGAWSWRTLYDPDAPVPLAERPSPIAGLVTVGRRDDRQLMVNLEALGTICVHGDATAATDLVRSMVFELASCDEIADSTVAVTTDLADLAVELLPGVAVLTAEDAAPALADAGQDALTVLDGLDTDSTFGYRTYDTPVLPHPVSVVVADPAQAATAQLVRPNRGVALILLGDADAADSWIDVHGDGTATLQPLGLTFDASGLPPATLDAVDHLEHEIADEAGDHAADSQQTREGQSDVAPPLRPWWLDSIDAEPSDAGGGVSHRHEEDSGTAKRSEVPIIDLTEDGPHEPPPLPPQREHPRMLVKVLGAPRIVDGPDLGRRELNVITFVACSPRPVSHEHIQDAIWGGNAISTKTVFNLIGSARTALGKWDGQPVLGAATRPHNTISLHPDVRTDLDLLRDLVDAAEQAPSTEALALLVEALELVEGPPFDAAGYDWAITAQLVAEAEHLIERAATRAAELALDVGDVTSARWAVTVGLRAIPSDAALDRVLAHLEATAGTGSAARRAKEAYSSMSRAE